MTKFSTVLVVDGTGPVADAIDKLTGLALKELIDSLWVVDAGAGQGKPWQATLIGAPGKRDVPLFTSLGQVESHGICISALATAGDDLKAAEVAHVADLLHDQARALAPSDSAVRDVRIWFPDWEDMASPGEGFFTPKVHSNLVVIPEDRRSDDHVAAPLTPPEGDVFAGHIASELSVLLGLFAGMETGPIDDMGPGVIFGDNPKIRLVRSFVRIGLSPELPLQDIVEHEGRLPLPPGTIEAPSPQAAVSELARRSDVILDRLTFEMKEPDALERLQMGPGETLGLVLKEMVSFVGRLPQRAVAGVLEDFSELAGRTMQDLVGASSIVEVVWKGKLNPRSAESEDFESVVADMRREAERRLDLEGGPSIDQAVWTDMSALVLAAVDGGELPNGIDPVEIHGRRAVINDAPSIAPRPGETLVETAASIVDESESASPTSLVGRIGAKVEDVAVANRDSMRQLLDRLDASIENLMAYRPPTLGFLHLSGAVLFAAFLVSVLLFSGAARGMGLTRLSFELRTIVYAVLTLGTLGFLYLFRTYAVEAIQEGVPKGAHSGDDESKVGWSETWIGAAVGAVVAGLFIGFGVAALGYPSTEPATYSALLTGVVTGAGLGQALTLGRFQTEVISAGRMARLSIVAVLVYGSILTIGAVAQPNGWYASASGTEVRSWLLPIAGSLLLLLIGVIAYVSWRRVQERLFLNAFGSNIRQLADQVNDALVGDRIAEAAREQFLGLSAVLSRLIWYPYGKPSRSAGTGQPIVEPFDVNKAAVCEFGLSERGQRLFAARTKSLAAERGWLGEQYERSILRFREELAVLIGAKDLDSVGRPDQDPVSVSHYDMESRADKGDRWRWADQLFAGEFDADLMEALEMQGEEDVFNPILSDGENFVPVGGCEGDMSLMSFSAEILVDGPTSADARYFDDFQLAQAQFSKEWHPQIWWPQEKLFDGADDTEMHKLDPVGSMARGRAWIALRADMTEDIQPAALFGERRTESEIQTSSGPEF